MTTHFTLKNRTSTVAPELTAARVEKMLAQSGATDIRKRYTDGELLGVDFVIPTEFGVIAFRLPINIEAAYQVLIKARPRYTTQAQRKAIREQAARSAWKLAQEWLEIQLSLVAMKQAELVQVLLPYVVRNEQTLFDAFRAGGYQALLAGPAAVEGK